jgi:hypothetical protein
MTQNAANGAREFRLLELRDRSDDLLAECQQPIAVKRVVVAAEDRSEGVGHRGGVEELVLDDVDALEERGDRSEQPVARVELLDREAGRLT